MSPEEEQEVEIARAGERVEQRQLRRGVQLLGRKAAQPIGVREPDDR